ncbi:MAG: hypothetical protein ACM3PS_15470 [Syntrophothermus sp.]
MEKRKRIQDGYEAGLCEKDEALQKMADVENEIDRLKTKIDESQWASLSRKEPEGEVQQNLDAFADWAKEADPAYVHRVVLAYAKRIITPDHQVIIDWR